MPNKVVSFLEKLGLGIIKYLPVALGISQMVEASAPAGSPVVQQLDKLDSFIVAAQNIEQDFQRAFAGQQTGSQKIVALTGQVSDILNQLQLVGIHTVADPAMLQKSAQGFAQATVDLLKALKGKDGSTVVGVTTVKP